MKIIHILFLALSVSSLAGCKAQDVPHQHSFSEEWLFDSSYHWHESTCGHDVKDSLEAHYFGDWIIDKEPTEYECGSKHRKCLICDYLVNEDIEVLEHTHKPSDSIIENNISPTCISTGSYDLVTYCKECSEELSRTHVTVDALGHDLSHHPGLEATCLEDGYTEYDECNRCDYSTKVIIPATGHTSLFEVEENRIESTCVSVGSYDLVTYCNVDHVEVSREHIEIPKKPHTYIDVIIEPTYHSQGYTTHTCSFCGISYVDSYTDVLTYKISFNLLGGTYGPSIQEKQAEKDITITDIIPTWEHHKFVGWNCYESDEIIYPGDVYSKDADITLYALWKNECTHCDESGINDVCNYCSGTGKPIGELYKQCPTCQGTGNVAASSKTCSYCYGDKAFINSNCHNCGYHVYAHCNPQTGAGYCPKCDQLMWDYTITTCGYCQGSGYSGGYKTCPTCNGKGNVCYYCQGSGVYKHVCEYCSGTKYCLPDAPSVSELWSRVTNESVTISLIGKTGYEYSMDGVNFQKSYEFYGLKHSTTYRFYQRKASDDVSPWGLTSLPLIYQTKPLPSYSITYVLDKDSTNSSENINIYNIETEFVFKNPSKPGFTFLGWFNADYSIQYFGIKKGSTGNLVLYPKWNNGNVYTIHLDSNGGKLETNTIDVSYNQAINLPEPSKPGYTFLGWYLYNTLITNGSKYSYTFDINLLAKWEVITYSVTYILNGGTNSSLNPSKYTVEKGFHLNSPKRTGYAFLGWYLNDNPISDIEDGTFGDLVIEAKWRLMKYKLEVYSTNYERGVATIISGEGYYGESITIKATPNDGYIFSGWYDSNNTLISSEQNYTFIMPDKGVILFAHFYSMDEFYGAAPLISSDNQTLEFGLFPQKRISDPEIIESLEQMEPNNFMGWYFYDGNYYAKTIASPFMYWYDDRHIYFEDGDEIINGETYWFKCERIKWRILEDNDNEYFLLSDICLDVKTKNAISNSSIFEERHTLANWLNNYFLKEAFGYASGYSASYEQVSSVSLLTQEDYQNESYGFKTNDDRKCVASDWAKARGASYLLNNSLNNFTSYRIGDPDGDNNVYYTGDIYSNYTEEKQIDSVRPAIRLKKA